MSVQSFVPQVWSAKILSNLDNQHVFKKGTNQDYEGEIKDFGSSVVINSLGRIAVGDYTRNADLAAPEILDTEGQILVIDQGKTIHFFVDDVDARQARGDLMGRAKEEATYAFAEEVDEFLGAKMQAGAVTTITAATVGLGAGEKSIYNKIIEMGLALDEVNCPQATRCVFVPMWGEALLRLDDRFVGFGTDASRSTIRGAPIGEINGMTVYKSNKIPRDGSEYSIIATYKGATTFAEQIVKVEAYSPERRFGDAVKGLHVYGAKVTRPECVVRFDATRGSLDE